MSELRKIDKREFLYCSIHQGSNCHRNIFCLNPLCPSKGPVCYLCVFSEPHVNNCDSYVTPLRLIQREEDSSGFIKTEFITKIESHLEEITKLKNRFSEVIEEYQRNIYHNLEVLKAQENFNIEDSLGKFERKDFTTKEDFDKTFSELLEDIRRADEINGNQWIYSSRVSQIPQIQSQILNFQMSQREESNKTEDQLILLVSETVRVLAEEDINKDAENSKLSKRSDLLERIVRDKFNEKKICELEALVTKSNLNTSESDLLEKNNTHLGLDQSVRNHNKKESRKLIQAQQPAESQSENKSVEESPELLSEDDQSIIKDNNEENIIKSERQMVPSLDLIEDNVSKQNRLYNDTHKDEENQRNQIDQEDQGGQIQAEQVVERDEKEDDNIFVGRNELLEGKQITDEEDPSNIYFSESKDEDCLKEKPNNTFENDVLIYNMKIQEHENKKTSKYIEQKYDGNISDDKDQEEVIRKEVPKQEVKYEEIENEDNKAHYEKRNDDTKKEEVQCYEQTKLTSDESSPTKTLYPKVSIFSENTSVLMETPGRFEKIECSNHIHILRRPEKRFDAVAFFTKEADVSLEGFGFYCPQPLMNKDINIEYRILDGVDEDAKVLLCERITIKNEEKMNDDDTSIERILIKTSIKLNKKRYYTIVLYYLDEVRIMYGEGKWQNVGPFIFSSITKKIVKHWLQIDYKLAEAEIMRSWQFPYFMYSKDSKV